MSAPAGFVAADNNAQQVEALQIPLPKFTLNPQNPMLFEYTLGNDPAAIDTFGKMIDQHNNSGHHAAKGVQ
jgi:hypothetical protein